MLNEGNLCLHVRYLRESDEDMTEAVLNAFDATEVDVYEEDTQLVDWINADVFERLDWSSDQPLYLCTRIWDHAVVMTPEEVRIYCTPDFR